MPCGGGVAGRLCIAAFFINLSVTHEAAGGKAVNKEREPGGEPACRELMFSCEDPSEWPRLLTPCLTRLSPEGRGHVTGGTLPLRFLRFES